MSKRKNYRQVLAENKKKTNVIIFIFLTMYIFIGLLADVALQYPGVVSQDPQAKLVDSFVNMVIIPWATITMMVIGFVSVMITFKAHDKMMLWGSEYEEIDSNSEISIEEKRLYNVVEELKIAANLTYMPKVYLIHADYMNAFASGYSEKSAMVAITTGLMEKLDRAELQAVMAHEISHIKHMDIKLTLFVGVLSNIMLLVLDLLMDFFRFTGGGSSKDNNNGGGHIKMIAFIVILALRLIFPIVALFLTMFLSRTREYMADAGAVKLTRDKDAMATALLKIHADYAEFEYDDPGVKVRKAAYIYNPVKSFFSEAFSTHPPIEERLRYLGHTFEKEKE